MDEERRTREELEAAIYGDKQIAAALRDKLQALPLGDRERVLTYGHLERLTETIRDLESALRRDYPPVGEV